MESKNNNRKLLTTLLLDILSLLSFGFEEMAMKLKVGTHEYFGQSIETTPIRTTSGLCYKVESKETNFEDETSFVFTVYYYNWGNDQDEKFEKINLYVVADNTWQGVIYGSWANTKNPLKVTGDFHDLSINVNFVKIEATEWTYMKGNGNYSQCLQEQEPISESCKSIFHPNSLKYESR